ncbi:protein EGG APPARATUS-1-like [Lolium rigidum]|uniref:protein EGG APPARATUS-1-like n=1 Tax=Lolium rigidum TaxID=89674 RepID=UPI001F5D53CD|nr:protein EGG APPARATUS-1-like [Lolium rigidum]
MNTRDLISGSLGSVKQQVQAMASTVCSASPADLRQKLAEMSRADLVAGLSHVKDQAAAAVSTREGAVKASVLVIGSAVSIYFLWPAAVAPAATVVMMKAPGAAGVLVSRVAFLAHKQVYYKVLRTAGAAAALAVLA